jgi:hypothetical protein
MIGHAGAGRLTGQMECLLNRRKVQRCQLLAWKNVRQGARNGLPDGYVTSSLRQRSMTNPSRWIVDVRPYTKPILALA